MALGCSGESTNRPIMRASHVEFDAVRLVSGMYVDSGELFGRISLDLWYLYCYVTDPLMALVGS